MSRILALLLFAVSISPAPVRAQNTPDVKVELRSAAGSNRFQVGEVIPLELVFSSTTPGRYLQPCIFLNRSCFGYPICRFANKWKFTIGPEQGWVDLDRSCATMSGPTFIVDDHDLTMQPKIIPYELTSRFRFDVPGNYTVHFTIDIGLDDASNPRPQLFKATEPTPERHSVTVSSDLQLEIVPASSQWQIEVIRKGTEAYSHPAPPVTTPPSPELAQYTKDTSGLCKLGTPEAAQALVGLLLHGHTSVTSCLERSPSIEAAIKEMERLLSDPETAISSEFFNELVVLKNDDNRKPTGFQFLRQPDVDDERERLVAALPSKRGDALSGSLVAVLQHPAAGKSTPFEMSHPLPFPDSIIALTAANFEHFPRDTQVWLLTEGWNTIHSPLMLPTVRRLAERGDGYSLLRWQELEPSPADAFERAETVRANPRFSSFYLRLPEPLLPQEEKQLASNFVELAERFNLSQSTLTHDTLVRLATLLHRYGTHDVLATVLPVIDTRRSAWPCAIEYPVLAYLLKVSPDAAAPKVEAALREANHGPCNTNSFFTDLGFLEPGPVLERLAFAQLANNHGPFAHDATEYLRRYASPSAKEQLWERLQYWQRCSAKTKRAGGEQSPTPEGQQIQTIAAGLTEAFERAQGWVLTPEDESRLRSLMGGENLEGAACRFQCGAKLSVAGPENVSIYMSRTERRFDRDPIMDYLTGPNPHRYSVRQYGCPNMEALKEKLVQFPAGSSFDFAWDFSAADRDELVEISEFLSHHGYKVRNPQQWDFLHPDSLQK